MVTSFLEQHNFQ